MLYGYCRSTTCLLLSAYTPKLQKVLKFKWRGQLYAYTCFANGLGDCPKYFTKLLKPVYTCLRAHGFLSASFIDDCYLQGQTISECQENINHTVNLFQSLGFTIHDEKSVLEPKKTLKYLGFILNSEQITVTLSPEKAARIQMACIDLKKRTVCFHYRVSSGHWENSCSFSWSKVGPTALQRNRKKKALALKKKKKKKKKMMMISYF